MDEKLEISACYKKVFELLNKVSSVQELIEKIAEFTETVIVMTDVLGRILMMSEEKAVQKTELFEELILELYQENRQSTEIQSFRMEGYPMGFSMGSFSVRGEDGFIFLFSDDEIMASQLVDIVRQAVGIIMERSGRSMRSHASSRRRLLARTLFEKLEISEQQLEEEHINGPYLAMVLEGKSPAKEQLQKIENELIDMFEKVIAHIEEAKIYLLFYDVFHEEQGGVLERKIADFCEKNVLRSVVGERFSEIALLKQKKFLLSETLKRSREEENACHEYDFYLEIVCSCAADKIGKARYMEQKLQKLWKEDVAKGTEFYRSLKEYLLMRNNVSMTAKKLFIHRNTMIYRLSRVTEILEVDVNDPAVANNLLISMILQEIERNRS